MKEETKKDWQDKNGAGLWGMKKPFLMCKAPCEKYQGWTNYPKIKRTNWNPCSGLNKGLLRFCIDQ